MPEDTELTVFQLSCLAGLDCFIDTEILVVPCKNLYGLSTGMVKEDKVLEQIHEVMLFADAQKHRFQIDRTYFVFFQSFPLMEELIF